MNNKLFLLVFSLAFSVGCIYFLFSTGFTPSQKKTVTLPTQQPSTTSAPISHPEDIVHSFYSWYITRAQNPQQNASYTTRIELSDTFKDYVKKEIAAMEQGGYDPFLCAQDIPQQMLVGVADIQGESATVPVEQTFTTGKRLLPVLLRKNSNTWEIEAVMCDKVEIQKGLGTQQTVIYFSNLEREGDSSDCSLVYGVPRDVPKTKQLIDVSLRALFAGPTQEEMRKGYTSFFSQKTKDILINVVVKERTAYINLKDIRLLIPNASTSCGSAQFMAQVEETVKHFRTVDTVIYAIEGDPETFYEWMQIGCSEANTVCDPTPFH